MAEVEKIIDLIQSIESLTHPKQLPELVNRIYAEYKPIWEAATEQNDREARDALSQINREFLKIPIGHLIGKKLIADFPNHLGLAIDKRLEALNDELQKEKVDTVAATKPIREIYRALIINKDINHLLENKEEEHKGTSEWIDNLPILKALDHEMARANDRFLNKEKYEVISKKGNFSDSADFKDGLIQAKQREVERFTDKLLECLQNIEAINNEELKPASKAKKQREVLTGFFKENLLFQPLPNQMHFTYYKESDADPLLQHKGKSFYLKEADTIHPSLMDNLIDGKNDIYIKNYDITLYRNKDLAPDTKEAQPCPMEVYNAAFKKLEGSSMWGFRGYGYATFDPNKISLAKQVAQWTSATPEFAFRLATVETKILEKGFALMQVSTLPKKLRFTTSFGKERGLLAKNPDLKDIYEGRTVRELFEIFKPSFENGVIHLSEQKYGEEHFPDGRKREGTNKMVEFQFAGKEKVNTYNPLLEGHLDNTFSPDDLGNNLQLNKPEGKKFGHHTEFQENDLGFESRPHKEGASYEGGDYGRNHGNFLIYYDHELEIPMFAKIPYLANEITGSKIEIILDKIVNELAKNNPELSQMLEDSRKAEAGIQLLVNTGIPKETIRQIKKFDAAQAAKNSSFTSLT